MLLATMEVALDDSASAVGAWVSMVVLATGAVAAALVLPAASTTCTDTATRPATISGLALVTVKLAVPLWLAVL